MVNYVSYEEALELHRRIIKETGGEYGVLNQGLLKFTLEFVSEHGKDLFDKAAFTLYNIAVGHPFINGNKRAALMIAELFLLKNGFKLVYNVDEALSFMLNVARGTLRLSQVKSWIMDHKEKYFKGEM